MVYLRLIIRIRNKCFSDKAMNSIGFLVETYTIITTTIFCTFRPVFWMTRLTRYENQPVGTDHDSQYRMLLHLNHSLPLFSASDFSTRWFSAWPSRYQI